MRKCTDFVDQRQVLRNESCRFIRETHVQGDQRRINQVIEQLVEMFSNPNNPLHVKNGGLIGLAGTAIALGVEVAPYMEKFIEPLLVCFSDPENRIRYFSAECLYNIAKVSKGEILIYFNSIFDALSKVCMSFFLDVVTVINHPTLHTITARCRLRTICQERGRATRSSSEGYRRRVCICLRTAVCRVGKRPPFRRPASEVRYLGSSSRRGRRIRRNEEEGVFISCVYSAAIRSNICRLAVY